VFGQLEVCVVERSPVVREEERGRRVLVNIDDHDHRQSFHT
jgi:hypothetical protein